MKPGRINITKEQIVEFCQKSHIKKLAFFGSVLRDDFKKKSDIDVLVDFDPNAKMDLIRMAEIEIELSKIIGKKVDLRTPQDLSVYFRDKVIAEAEVQYERE
jgi:uncharacterized protein